MTFDTLWHEESHSLLLITESPHFSPCRAHLFQSLLCLKRVPCRLRLIPCVLNVFPSPPVDSLCFNVSPSPPVDSLCFNVSPSPPGTSSPYSWSRTSPPDAWPATIVAPPSWSPTLSNVSVANLSYIMYNILILPPESCLFIKSLGCESGGSHDLVFVRPSRKELACSSSNSL